MFSALSPSLKGILLALLAFTCFSFADASGKWLSGAYNIYVIVGVEYIFGCLFLLTIIAVQGGIKTIANKNELQDWRVHAMRGVLNFLINIIAVYLFTEVALATLYTAVFLIPLIATGLAILIYKEPLLRHRLLSILVGFTGVLIAFQPWKNPLELSPLTGAALLGLPLCVAFMHLISKSYKHSNANGMAFWPMLISLIIVAPITVMNIEPVQITHLPLFAFGGSAIAIGISALAMSFKIGNASTVSSMVYIQMLWGIIFGYTLFGDTPDAWMLIGAAIITGSGIYLVLKERKTIPAAA